MPNGDTPNSGLTRDARGNFYGVTAFGGDYDDGAAFELSKGKERVLYSFGQPHDGTQPNSRLVRDAEGKLYGTTVEGYEASAGVVFEIATDGTETILHTFCSESNCTDGEYPYGDLIMDGQGNLYGTTADGGAHGYGVIFKISTVPVSDQPTQ